MPHALITGGISGYRRVFVRLDSSVRARRAFVFCGALAVALVFWAAAPRLQLGTPSDFDGFHRPVAESLLRGRGLTADGETLATRYPPGYALLLAGVWAATAPVGLTPAAGVLTLNLVSVGLSAVFLCEIASLVTTPVAGLMAAALWMTYPFMLVLSRAPLTELPFCALFYAGLLLWARSLRRSGRGALVALAGGALLGAAMLVRPIAIGAPLVLACIILASGHGAWRRRVALGAALLCGALLAVLPWEILVLRRTGQLIPLSTGGPPSIRDGLTFAVHPGKAYRRPREIPADIRAVQMAVLERYSRLNGVGAIAEVIFEQARQRPLALFKFVVWKAARAWYGTDTGRWEWPILPIQLIYLLVMAAGAVIAFRNPDTRGLALVLAALIAYFWVMTVLTLSILRYMLPAMGLGFALAGLGAGGFPWQRNLRHVH